MGMGRNSTAVFDVLLEWGMGIGHVLGFPYTTNSSVVHLVMLLIRMLHVVSSAHSSVSVSVLPGTVTGTTF